MYWLLAVGLTLLPIAGEESTRVDRRRAALRAGIAFVVLYGLRLRHDEVTHPIDSKVRVAE